MDVHHPSVRQAIKDRQDMHRNLVQIFKAGFLYRIVADNKAGPELLILSKQPPDQSAMDSRGYRLLSIRDMSALPELYDDGAVLKFDLLSVPSKKAKENREGNSRRVYLTDPVARADWLKRQGSKYGFDVLVVNEPSAEQTITVGRSTGAFQLTAIELSGVLRIINASQFWSSWEKGIGPEKAYGMGLMLLSK